MWFGPPERNTLRPQENRVVLPKPGHARVSLSLSSGCQSVFDPCEDVSTRSFYSSRTGSCNETWDSTGGPEVVETLYSI
jgi:hypothetical protein